MGFGCCRSSGAGIGQQVSSAWTLSSMVIPLWPTLLLPQDLQRPETDIELRIQAAAKPPHRRLPFDPTIWADVWKFLVLGDSVWADGTDRIKKFLFLDERA